MRGRHNVDGKPLYCQGKIADIAAVFAGFAEWLYNSGNEEDTWIPDEYFFKELPTYQPINRLSGNMSESFKMMADIEKIVKRLPDIDCGSCGAPSCHAFAEDIVLGEATENDCIFRMREQIQSLLQRKEEQNHDSE